MSYDSARRRGKVAGAHARRKAADVHEGTRADRLRRHGLEAAEAARGNGKAMRNFAAKLLPRTADSRNLRLAWDHLARGDGRAPGLDGLRFDDLEDGEVWDLVRTLRQALLDGSYRPAEDRQKAIPKAGGKGVRTLSIPSVIDRVVQRALVQTLQPYLDAFFDDDSFGYRPHGHVQLALARAGELAVENDAWCWLTEDLKDAFDHVPQERLLDVLRKHIPNKRMMRRIGRVVRTRTGRGPRQGGNFSPLLLNVYLDHFLDKKWRRLHPDAALVRWADDVLILCRSMEEALQARRDLERLLLPAGMALKTDPRQAVHDLKDGDDAEWLGFRLFREGGGLKASLTEKAWKSLETKLGLDHEKDGSPLRAAETIRGWLSQMGPCFEQTDVEQACARIVTLARNLAFDEVPSLEEMRRTWRAAHLKWGSVQDVKREGAHGRPGGGVAGRHSEPAGPCRAGRAS